MVSKLGTTACAFRVTRSTDNPRVLIVSFRSEPTDDDMRILHEALRPVDDGKYIFKGAKQ